MARWLTTVAATARREEILALLQREEAPLHWWPVLRQLLVLVDEPELRDLVRQLPVEPLAAFRTLSLAAAIRAEVELLGKLLDRALALGTSRSRRRRGMCVLRLRRFGRKGAASRGGEGAGASDPGCPLD